MFLGCGGCLGTVIVALLLLFGLTTYFLKKSQLYTDVQSRVASSVELKQALGDDVKPGALIQGAPGMSEGQVTLDLAIPLEGTKGKATLIMKAHLPSGTTKWQYSVLEAQLENGKVIDLRDKPAEPAALPAPASAPAAPAAPSAPAP